MKPGAENQVSFSEIRIQDGVLNYEDAANQRFGSTRRHRPVAGLAFDLALLCRDGSVRLARRVDGSVSAGDFVAMLSGDRSGLKARLASAPIKLAFDGTVANRTSMMIGTVTIDSPSLRNALRWMGQPVPGGSRNSAVLRSRPVPIWWAHRSR